jgi:hypothetical protein
MAQTSRIAPLENAPTQRKFPQEVRAGSPSLSLDYRKSRPFRCGRKNKNPMNPTISASAKL